MYKLLLADITETKYFSKGRPPLGYTQWKTDLIYFSKIVVHIRHGSPRGYFGNFWVGCAVGTLEPLAYTRASSAEFCYPILV